MSKLMDKLRKEKERLTKSAEGRGNFEKTDWFRPEKGDNLVRFLPNLEDPDGELPFKHVRTHYIGIEKKDGGTVNIPVRCLRDFEEDCPVCDEYEKMVRKDKDKAKPFRAREAYVYNIIDYKNKSVHPYSAGVTVHEQIMGFADDFSGNIFSTEEGRDWKLVKKVDPRKPAMLGVSYALRPGMKDTALPKKLEALLEGAEDIDKLYEDNERKKMLEWLGYDVEDESDEPEEDGIDIEAEFEEEEAPKKKAKKAAAKAKKKAAPPEFDEDEDMPEFDEEPAQTKKSKKKSKAAEVDTEDDELDEELKALGVM